MLQAPMDLFDPLTDQMKDIVKQAVDAGTQMLFIKALLGCHYKNFRLDVLEIERFKRKCERDRLRGQGPIRQNELQCMLECMAIVNKSAHFPSPWILRYATNTRNHVRAVFWMSPNQVTLYQWHRDILVHDTTQCTNKFNMAMHNIVVVDAAFKTRLVASALTSGEKIQD
ncbi:hypothetical protein BGX24_006815, partial [Mortierella sp. AD032]